MIYIHTIVLQWHHTSIIIQYCFILFYVRSIKYMCSLSDQRAYIYKIMLDDHSELWGYGITVKPIYTYVCKNPMVKNHLVGLTDTMSVFRGNSWGLHHWHTIPESLLSVKDVWLNILHRSSSCPFSSIFVCIQLYVLTHLSRPREIHTTQSKRKPRSWHFLRQVTYSIV